MLLRFVALTAVVFVALLCIAFFIIRSRVRNFVGGLKNIGRPARRIHLMRKTQLDWQDRAKVRALVDPLLNRGFKDAGVFEIPEIPGLRMQALVHADNGALGAIYEFPQRGAWLDLVFRFEDGGGLTCTTNPGPSLEARPGFPKVRQAEQDSVMLYERLLREKPSERKIALVGIADFVPLFEKAYADEMDWHAARGITASEVKSTAAATGRAEVSEETLSLTKTLHDAQQLRNLDESFRERFAGEQKIPEQAWKTMQPHVIVVHDRLPAKMVREQFEKLSKAAGLTLSFSDNSIASTRQQFEELNAQLPSGKRFERLGEVRIDPLTADVWKSPE
jgi:hypothetical protein